MVWDDQCMVTERLVEGGGRSASTSQKGSDGGKPWWVWRWEGDESIPVTPGNYNLFLRMSGALNPNISPRCTISRQRSYPVVALGVVLVGGPPPCQENAMISLQVDWLVGWLVGEARPPTCARQAGIWSPLSGLP